jgi:type VI protein secretion system component VasF
MRLPRVPRITTLEGTWKNIRRRRQIITTISIWGGALAVLLLLLCLYVLLR